MRMLECLFFKSLTPSSQFASVPNLPPPSHSQDEDTPVTSGRSSPAAAANVSREFDRAVQANSYKEIQLRIQGPSQDQVHLVDVILPNRESVQEALENAKPSTLTRIVSTYFDHSENACELFLLLQQSVHRARTMYAPIHDLLDVLPADSTTYIAEPHCNVAFDIFVEFDRQDNPFPSPDSHDFGHMRRCFSILKNQLEGRRRKSLSRIRLLRRATTGCALCFIITAVGVAASAVAVAAHAVVAVAAAAAPVCTVYIPHPKTTERKELARLAQLDAVVMVTYVADDIATIDSLVDRLHTAVEGDKGLVRFALERGRDRHSIQEVLKQLRKNKHSFLHQLEELEQHIYLCLNTVNKARSSLLQQIYLHQTL